MCFISFCNKLPYKHHKHFINAYGVECFLFKIKSKILVIGLDENHLILRLHNNSIHEDIKIPPVKWQNESGLNNTIAVINFLNMTLTRRENEA